MIAELELDSFSHLLCGVYLRVELIKWEKVWKGMERYEKQ